MKLTKWFKFKKPDPFDTVNINDLNDSFDMIDEKLRETEQENKNLSSTFKELIINAGNSNAEIVDARVDKSGKRYDTIGERLDKEHEEVSAHLEQKANISNVQAINSQISNIIAHNGDGIKDSEIVQARGVEASLVDRLSNIDNNGINLMEQGMEEPGQPFYGTNVFNGWGIILKLKATKISQIAIAKGSNNTISNDVTVRLFETSSATSISDAKLIEEFIITSTDWNNLPIGGTKKLTLNNAYNVNSNMYYAVTVYSSNINVMQCGTKDGVVYPKYDSYVQGLFCRDATNTTYELSNYGCYCKIYQDILLNKELKLNGYQVPEHDKDISELKSVQSIISKTGYFVKNSNESGVGGYINSLDVASAKGWGVILQTNLSKITRISVKKAINKNKTYTAETIAVKLYETPDFNTISNATLIESFSIDVQDWQKSNGEEIILDLTAPYSTKANMYYAVTIHADETIDCQQVGVNGNIDIKTTDYYKYGIWSPSTDEKSSYGSAGGGSYGLYAKLYNGLEEKFLLIEGEQVPTHEKRIKTIEDKVSVLESKSLDDKIDINHFTSPLLKVPTFTKNWLKQNKDMYIDLYGDSITAWQTSFEKNPLGVSASPPVCDRMGLAGITESIIRYGSPVYRRFDYGKNSLVGQWDNTWFSADDPYFTEVGNFITCYSSSLDNHDSREYDNMLTLPQITTKITQRICPIPSFHRYDYERHIPKRVCSDSNASIQFTIPSGYKKFDFLYHTNQLGDDNVTIAIVEGSGKVKLNNDKRSLGCTTEANGFILNTKETHLESEDGYDSGVLCRRLYFEKVNITDTITVKITKSTDTTKYLMYWGVTYWGTIDEPNACHLIVTGRGSYNSLEMYKKRFHDIGIWDIDLIIHERTIINSFNAWGNGTTPNFDYDNEKFKLLYDYIVSLNIPMITLLPHTFTTALNKPKIYRKYWNQSKSQHIELGLETIDIEKSMYVCWDKNYKSKLTYLDFVKSLMYDGYAHPNEEGFKFYQRFLEHTFNMI